MASVAPEERERAEGHLMAARKKTDPGTLRRCVGSARFGIEPHDAPLKDFPIQPSQKDGLGRMCATHWKAYVKGLNAERKARTAAEANAPSGPSKAERSATTKRERRRTPAASKVAPASPRVRRARETLAATETLGGTAYTEAIGSPEVQDALETVNGSRHVDDEPEEVARIALEQDPRSEDEIRAQEGDAA